MPAETTLIGMIEVEIPEGRTLGAMLETLVQDDLAPRTTVLCRIRREPLKSSVDADLPQLTESLESAYDALQSRLSRF